jgi:5'-nucleotidase
MLKNIAVIISTLIILCGMLLQATACRSSDIELTIIHTNDSHSHLDNIARLATVISGIREEAGNDNSMLLDAGDICGGTVYYSLYQGQADSYFMEQLGYDAVCPGNHEFDDGIEFFLSFMESIDIPVVCANIGFSSGSDINKTPVPWVIIEKNGGRYGIFGLLTEETMEISSPGKELIISDPVAAARKAVAELQHQGINKIIALTTGWRRRPRGGRGGIWSEEGGGGLGVAGVVAGWRVWWGGEGVWEEVGGLTAGLASAVEGIDIIVGAHSATLPDIYPAEISVYDARTLVVQAGDYREYLGRLDVVFDKNGVLKSWDGELIAVDDTIVEDAAIAAVLSVLQQPMSGMMTDVIGQTSVFLDGENDNIRRGETNLGNMIADAVLEKVKAAGADIVIVNSGGIRISVPAGNITREKLMEVLPFENYLVLVDITGEQLVAALENGVSQAEEFKGRFPQVAGIRFTWNSANEPGKRIVSVDVQTESGYVPLNENAVYRVVVNDYLYSGGDGFTVFQQGSNYINAGFTYFEIMLDYFMKNSPVAPQTDGRIIDIAE